MNAILTFLFGSPRRALTTALCALVTWGIIDPHSMQSLIETCMKNFWMAFGPFIFVLLELVFIVGFLAFLVWLIGKLFGIGNNRSRRS